MPKTEPGLTPGDDQRQSRGDASLLEARVREAEERSLDFWLDAVRTTAAGSMTVTKLQQSISWRITKPLRAVRLVQRKVQETGVRRTAAMVKVRVNQIRQARKRG